jgi:hypothetical protein
MLNRAVSIEGGMTATDPTCSITSSGPFAEVELKRIVRHRLDFWVVGSIFCRSSRNSLRKRSEEGSRPFAAANGYIAPVKIATSKVSEVAARFATDEARATPILTTREAVNTEHAIARGVIITVDDPMEGEAQ